MTLQKVLATAALLVVAATASAQVEEQQEMKFVVAGAVGDEATAIHWVSSGDAGFDMHAMQVGETQSIIDDAGRSILITREENGFRFDVDGKSVVVPEIGAPGKYMTFAAGPDAMADFDVEIVGDQFALPTHSEKSITILSGEPLDASTQESIKAVLLSAGRDDTVRFVDSGSTSDVGQVKIISKRVEIEQ